jgi:hypothetical protein
LTSASSKVAAVGQEVLTKAVAPVADETRAAAQMSTAPQTALRVEVATGAEANVSANTATSQSVVKQTEVRVARSDESAPLASAPVSDTVTESTMTFADSSSELTLSPRALAVAPRKPVAEVATRATAPAMSARALVSSEDVAERVRLKLSAL